MQGRLPRPESFIRILESLLTALAGVGNVVYSSPNLAAWWTRAEKLALDILEDIRFWAVGWVVRIRWVSAPRALGTLGPLGPLGPSGPLRWIAACLLLLLCDHLAAPCLILAQRRPLVGLKPSTRSNLLSLTRIGTCSSTLRVAPTTSRTCAMPTSSLTPMSRCRLARRSSCRRRTITWASSAATCAPAAGVWDLSTLSRQRSRRSRPLTSKTEWRCSCASFASISLGTALDSFIALPAAASLVAALLAAALPAAALPAAAFASARARLAHPEMLLRIGTRSHRSLRRARLTTPSSAL